MNTLVIDISGMTCGGCSGIALRPLKKIARVSHAEVTLKPGVATVVTDPARVWPAQTELAIISLGYPARRHGRSRSTGPAMSRKSCKERPSREGHTAHPVTTAATRRPLFQATPCCWPAELFLLVKA